MTQFSNQPTEPLPRGSYPALLTAFHENHAIDWQGVEQLTDYAIDNGSAGMFAAGLSAEINFMTDEEKVSLVRHIVQYTAGRVPIVGCAITTGPLTTQAELIRQVNATGVDAVAISVCQLANKDEDDQAWVRNCQTLLQQTPERIALAVYECPAPYHRLLSEETIAWIARTGRFCFLKDTCCRAEVIRTRLEIIRGSRLKLYNANTATLLDSLEAGASGFCGIGANYAPELYAWLCREFQNRPKLAAELHQYLADCVRLTEGSSYPVSAKEYLRQHGLQLDRFSRKRPPDLSGDLLAGLNSMQLADSVWKARILG
ncbi:MAG: dihydrodipicolinate synthase family protein [Planctomycetes bacterium]|nr:dihydrodipicolinate synthase family protein [Planctomycetota bacterium]